MRRKALFDKLSAERRDPLFSEHRGRKGKSARRGLYRRYDQHPFQEGFPPTSNGFAALLSTIGERSKLLQILNECVARDEKSQAGAVQVIIGSENPTPTLQNCSLISAPYRIGDGSAIGTLERARAHTRMEYARMISIVSYVARKCWRERSPERSQQLT